MPHPPHKLGPRNVYPLAAPFFTDGVRLVVTQQGLETEARQGRRHSNFCFLTSDNGTLTLELGGGHGRHLKNRSPKKEGRCCRLIGKAPTDYNVPRASYK